MSANAATLSFIDTNIWLYGFIESDQGDKSRRARDLIVNSQPVISVQIINEVCVNLIKKAGFSESKISQLITSFFENYQVIELEQETLMTASELRLRYAVSFWDSLVIASALQAQVSVLYSEDLQHEQVIEDRLKIINPFVN
jgi:predicted nucleic acid-binding protein